MRDRQHYQWRTTLQALQTRENELDSLLGRRGRDSCQHEMGQFGWLRGYCQDEGICIETMVFEKKPGVDEWQPESRHLGCGRAAAVCKICHLDEEKRRP